MGVGKYTVFVLFPRKKDDVSLLFHLARARTTLLNREPGRQLHKCNISDRYPADWRVPLARRPNGREGFFRKQRRGGRSAVRSLHIAGAFHGFVWASFGISLWFAATDQGPAADRHLRKKKHQPLSTFLHYQEDFEVFALLHLQPDLNVFRDHCNSALYHNIHLWFCWNNSNKAPCWF